MKRRRFLAIWLSFALLLSCLPLTAEAAAMRRIAVTGAPEALTVGQTLPTRGLRLFGGWVENVFWFSSRDGKGVE